MSGGIEAIDWHRVGRMFAGVPGYRVDIGALDLKSRVLALVCVVCVSLHRATYSHPALFAYVMDVCVCVGLRGCIASN